VTRGLTVEGLGHRYPGGPEDALADVTLSVGPGQVLTVVGPSGSGKSTLLRLVAGLHACQRGRIVIGAADVTRTAPERRPVAMVFQGFALFPHLTVGENIGFGLRVRGVGRRERNATVQRIAAVLQLDALLRRLPHELSGGERQRTALARALVRDPLVFCLDEPLSSLDPLLRSDARQELGRVLRAEGRCAVYVTHDQTDALTMGDRVAVLRNGRVEQLADPRTVYRSPATRFVASFVGSPPMNLLTASGGAAGPLRPSTPVADVVVLGVHAEDVIVGRGGDVAHVRGIEDHGHEVHVALDVGGQRLVARLGPDHSVAVGATVEVRVDPAKVHVFGGASAAAQ
jgi:multiple sugar transport system ATP-binding protein